jgi:hypothetical protein
MTVLGFIFWWGTLPLQVVILYFLFRHRTLRAFPFFFSYTIFSIFAGVGRFALRNTSYPYFYFYWITAAIYAVLGLAVLYEVYRAVFGNLKNAFWFRAIFPVVVLFTLALTLSRNSGLLTGKISALDIILSSELAVSLLRVALFVLLVSLVALFGLRWRQYAFGISAGFGIYATSSLFASTKFYEIGTKFTLWWSAIPNIAYALSVLIWLWYFSQAEGTPRPRTEYPPLSVLELQQYKQAMQKARHI